MGIYLSTVTLGERVFPNKLESLPHRRGGVYSSTMAMASFLQAKNISFGQVSGVMVKAIRFMRIPDSENFIFPLVQGISSSIEQCLP